MIKLICLDLDGVLYEPRQFWLEVHEAFGTLEEGVELTKQYLKSDYARLVEEVVGRLWKGLDAAPFIKLVENTPYMQGIEELFSFIHAQGWETAIVSASDIRCAQRVKQDFGVNHLFANELVISDGRVDGTFVWPIGEGMMEKARVVRELCARLGVSPDDAVYVGDSRKDVEVFRIVGHSVAFNSNSEELKRVASAVVDSRDLRDVVRAIQTFA